jgi:predicted negative regulator of RcsB-dependent stress response
MKFEFRQSVFHPSLSVIYILVNMLGWTRYKKKSHPENQNGSILLAIIVTSF